MLVFLLFFLSASLAIPLNHTVPGNEIHAGDPFEEVINGVKRTCYWDGTAPACIGRCNDLFDEMDRQPRKNIPDGCWFITSGCQRDPYFGEPCLYWTTKPKCCLKI